MAGLAEPLASLPQWFISLSANRHAGDVPLQETLAIPGKKPTPKSPESVGGAPETTFAHLGRMGRGCEGRRKLFSQRRGTCGRKQRLAAG